MRVERHIWALWRDIVDPFRCCFFSFHFLFLFFYCSIFLFSLFLLSLVSVPRCVQQQFACVQFLFWALLPLSHLDPRCLDLVCRRKEDMRGSSDLPGFLLLLLAFSQAGKMGENLIDVSILMTFNKLKNIVKDAGLSTEGGLELVSPPPPHHLFYCQPYGRWPVSSINTRYLVSWKPCLSVSFFSSC